MEICYLSWRFSDFGHKQEYFSAYWEVIEYHPSRRIEIIMDFNFKKIASDASGFFSRAKQFTEETFLKAEKTELDAHFENLLQRADKTEEHTKRLLSCLESYLQPNPTVRMEEVFYEKLELRKEGGRMNNLEHLGQAMTDAGNEFGAGTPYGNALLKVAQAEFKLGAGERDFINNCASNTLLPIRRFLEGDMKTIQRERKVLNTKRLDLDAAKSRLRKAKSLEAQSSAEADLRVAQAEFDKQAEITKLLLEGIQTAHNNQLKCLRDFVEAQMSFYAQAHQHMADLQRELSGALSADSGISLYSNSNANSPPTSVRTAGKEATIAQQQNIERQPSAGGDASGASK
uniref:BAR domain-containing protein n=3 Tax=Parascaris univalens TaxID=6257 RepID=A0A914ZM90_PARUN